MFTYCCPTRDHGDVCLHRLASDIPAAVLRNYGRMDMVLRVRLYQELLTSRRMGTLFFLTSTANLPGASLWPARSQCSNLRNHAIPISRIPCGKEGGAPQVRYHPTRWVGLPLTLFCLQASKVFHHLIRNTHIFLTPRPHLFPLPLPRSDRGSKSMSASGKKAPSSR